MQISREDLATWRLDVLLDSVVPIPSEALRDAQDLLGPAGGLSPDVKGTGRPIVSLYANALDLTSAQAALDHELGILLSRLQRWAPTAIRQTEVTYAGPAFPPAE